MCVADENFVDIIQFLSIGTIPEGYMMQKKKKLVVKAIGFSAFRALV